MNRRDKPARSTTAYAIAAAAALALGAVGALAAHDLAVQDAQAHALVTIGTTALAHGDRPSAILSFERASLLAPRSGFVRSALAAADVPAVGPPLARAVDWIAPGEWSFLAVAFGWVAGLGAAAVVARRGSRFVRALALCSGVAFVLSVGGVLESTLSSRALAVVTTAAGALVAPYEASGATGDLRPGEVVHVGERYGVYVRVSGPDGVQGWVTSAALRSVVGASV